MCNPPREAFSRRRALNLALLQKRRRMNLGETILAEHSKAQAMRIAEWVGTNRKRFGELTEFVLGGNETIARRAAWALTHCAELHPELVEPHLEDCVSKLSRIDTHQAVKRNLAKVLTFAELPEPLLGQIYDVCLGLLGDPNEPAAVRVYAMETLGRICEVEPALGPEVALVIEDALPHGTAAIRSRGRKTLKKIERLTGRSSPSQFGREFGG